jgi:hypothetical protein
MMPVCDRCGEDTGFVLRSDLYGPNLVVCVGDPDGSRPRHYLGLLLKYWDTEPSCACHSSWNRDFCDLIHRGKGRLAGGP